MGSASAVFDFADINDQTALLWNGSGVLRLFTGGVGLTGVPFRMQESRDKGATWRDTGGRTEGRHTAFVLMRDGSILGLGGKNTNIDGYMPQAISRDGGRSWTVSKTVFPALTSNQRLTVARLASGRIFFASDYQDRSGKQPAGVTEKGAFVALPEDEGQTWTMRK